MMHLIQTISPVGSMLCSLRLTLIALCLLMALAFGESSMAQTLSANQSNDGITDCLSSEFETELLATIDRINSTHQQPNPLLGNIPAVFEIETFVDEELTMPGLMGSYVDESLRDYSIQDDWRLTQTISGTRIDDQINFTTSTWGQRSEVGVTSGTDSNWDFFSVQWDGFLNVSQTGMRLRSRSDDGSRMWIDLNRDGVFEDSGDEFLNNGWGDGQAATSGPLSIALPIGVYPIRIQYEEGNGGNTMQLQAPPHVVRIAYLIPSNRSPQTNGVENLQWLAAQFPEYFREQMERNGFGEKTIRLEYESDGNTPKIHVVSLPDTDDYYRADDFEEPNDPIEIWNRVLPAASAAGVPLSAEGEVWLLVIEAHKQLDDGRIIGRVGLGASHGTGSVGGTALIESNRLPLINAKTMTNNQPYDGLIIEELGPYPLVQDVSFSFSNGSTLSSVASSGAGGALHELTHGFGLPHDLRNDQNFAGNLMGNGLRGFRGYFFPGLYPDDEMRLAYSTCKRLSVSRYFQTELTHQEDTRPTINSFVVRPTPVNGLLEIDIDVSDDTELASAFVYQINSSAGEVNLAGSTANTTIRTWGYVPGANNFFRLYVYDVYGNMSRMDMNITPDTGMNRAPEPKVFIRSTIPLAGQTVNLDASTSRDFDDPLSQLLVEWDLDNDGLFDTDPAFDLDLETTFDEIGPRQITVRLTDPAGASSVSSPIAIRVLLLGDINGDGAVDLLDVGPFVSQIVSGNYSPQADINGDGEVNLLDVAPFIDLLVGN